MDSTVEARFERIERILAETAEIALGNQKAIGLLAESSRIFSEKITEGLLSLAQYASASDNRLSALTDHVDRFVASSEARANMMETSLENLIRIIAAEHSNGKRRE